ncbi:putative Copper-fist domain-containing protein [Seiridium cardinale]|uniref:Copper-fist domain-containing protein n=1 Tax=Seiridium cardinale TaxID=138064 RepID=A0ABR2XAZ3_9PEZI
MPAPAAHGSGPLGCCCNHGGRCTCSHKKEPALDTVPESDSDDQETMQSKAKATARRRRANTTHSEPVLSFDENGHHKPPHKHNKLSQKCGPYTLTRGHSMHSTSSTSSMGNRSVDNLHKVPSRSRSKDLVAQDLESRKAKSEQTSPLITGNSAFQQLNGQLPPLDLSNIQYPEYTPAFELFHGLDEQPMFSAGLSAPSVDWAQYDGLDMKADNFAPSSYDQSQPYAAFDFGSTEPTLTSNSGDVSETEDFVPAFSEAQIEGFRMSAATDYMNIQQSAIAESDFSNADFDSFKGTAAANKFLPNLGSLEDTNGGFPMLEEESYWSMNSFADGITNSPDPVASTFWDTQ